MRAWKREFLEKMPLAFEKNRNLAALQRELEKAYQKIGLLRVLRVKIPSRVLSKLGQEFGA